MDFHHNVKKWFRESVRTNPDIDPALRDKLLRGNHPQVQTLVQNLEREIKNAQAVLMQKRRKPADEKTVKGFVYDLTDLFCRGLQEKAKRMYESDLARLERERKEQEVKDMEATLAGKPSGIFEEGGVIADDSREAKVQSQSPQN